MVDSHAPIVCKNMYSSPAKFNRSITSFVRIERENAIMLQRIATIMKSPPTIDNRLSFKQHSINIRSKAREMTLLRIAFDNLEMWKRIQTVVKFIKCKFTQISQLLFCTATSIRSETTIERFRICGEGHGYDMLTKI